MVALAFLMLTPFSFGMNFENGKNVANKLLNG